MKRSIAFIICCSFFILNGGKTISLKNKGTQEISKKLFPSQNKTKKKQKKTSSLNKEMIAQATPIQSPQIQPSPLQLTNLTFSKRKKIYQSFNKAFTSLAFLREELKNTENCIDSCKADLKIRLSVYSTYADYIDAQTKITEHSNSFQNHFLNPTSSLVKNLNSILDIRSNLLEEADLKEQLKLYMDQTTDIMFAISEYETIEKN